MAFSYPGWMHGVFRTLVGLFDWVGLMKFSVKMFGMVCCPCQAAGTQSEAAYKRQMVGMGPSYWEIQWMRVQYWGFGEEMEMR